MPIRRRARLKTVLTALAAAALLAVPFSSQAQRHGPGGGGYPQAPRHHFYGHPGPGWRSGGYWYHGGYGGRFGWWWVDGGNWVLYPTPVYRYPDYVPPPVLLPSPTQGAAPPQYWYWCSTSEAYYPYVDRCSVAWQAVTASTPEQNDGDTDDDTDDTATDAPEPAVPFAPPPP